MNTAANPPLRLPAMGMGCMGLSEFYSPIPPSESAATIRYAFDRGITFFDTADMYGEGENESLVSAALKPVRKQVVLASKFGIIRDAGGKRVDGSPAYAQRACEASLRRLQTEWIDLYYLHRVDPATPIEDSVGALSRLVEQGKVRAIGLSKIDSATLRRASRISRIDAVQMEYSLCQRDIETALLPCAREYGSTLVAYSPLCRGLLAGWNGSLESLDANDWRRRDPRFQNQGVPEIAGLCGRIERLARQLGCTATQVALAWLRDQQGVVPIPGMRTRRHVDENLAAFEIRLANEQIREIEKARPPQPCSL
ncbi:MAG TPA: aldo/keto reductase [Blastocatellia bacterium]|jgi:aryl-alcohol dehydrogenase-like predicted oxidoreductase